MNKILKFLPAALTAIALSSCSNDDLFSGNTEEVKGNTLKVTVETPVDDLTRAANVADGNALIWQENDVITVYDNNLFKYDPYKYATASKAFIKADDKVSIEAPAYALFPDRFFSSSNTHWDRNTNVVYAFANIPQMLNYGAAHDSYVGAEAYVANGGNPAYVSNLPLWGPATKEGEKTSASLQYTTAILKVKLSNAMGNVNYLYVRGFSDLAGTEPAQLNGRFKLTMSDSEGNALATSALETTIPSSDLTYGDNYLEINISNISKATSYIYVPVPVGHYGKLQVWATASQITPTMTYVTPGDPAYVIGSGDMIHEYIDKTFEVKFYATGNTKEYNIDATTPSKITALLNASKDETGAKVSINGASAATTTAADDKTITLPNMQADVVELKLKEFSGSNGVTINGDSFAKTFILNLTGSNNEEAITVNLPNGNIVLVGNYNAQAVNINAAKAVTFGDGSTNTTCTGTTKMLAEVYGPLSVKAKATTGALELVENHRISSVEIAGTAAALTVKGADQNDCTINVSGTVTGAIDNQDAGKITLTGNCNSITNKGAEIEISGAPNYAAAPYAKVNTTVSTEGNVTVNLSNEGAAIGTSLTMVANKTLTLTQGYIKAITVPNSGKNVTIALGNDDKYKTVPAITGNKFTVTGKTMWNGNKIGGTIDTDDKAEAIKEGLKTTRTAIISAWKGYKDPETAVYTAIGLAENASKFTLKNDIDLNNKAWTPAATTGNIDGNGKTISNLTVAVPANGAAATAATAGLGLFSELKNDVTNLVLDGVTINAAQYTTSNTKYTVHNIGALAGKVSATTTINAVTVKNVNLSSTGGAKAIGGVIGTNTDATTFSGVILTGTNTIEGYYQMGGLVGYAGANVTISTKAKATAPITSADVVCAATASFKANFNSATTTPSLDKNYLSVGNFIGSADKSATIVITCAAADVKGTKTVDTSIFSGYTKHNVGVNFYDYVFGQSLIGWSGDVTFTTAPKINNKNYQLYGNKTDWNNAAQYLYYINM